MEESVLADETHDIDHRPHILALTNYQVNSKDRFKTLGQRWKLPSCRKSVNPNRIISISLSKVLVKSDVLVRGLFIMLHHVLIFASRKS